MGKTTHAKRRQSISSFIICRRPVPPDMVLSMPIITFHSSNPCGNHAPLHWALRLSLELSPEPLEPPPREKVFLNQFKGP